MAQIGINLGNIEVMRVMILYFPYLFIYTFQLLAQVDRVSESNKLDIMKGAMVPLVTTLVIVAMTIPENSEAECTGDGSL